MGLTDFVEDDSDSADTSESADNNSSEQQSWSEEHRSEEESTVEEMGHRNKDLDQGYDSTLLVEYSSDGEYRGESPLQMGIIAVSTMPPKEEWEPGWVDISSQTVSEWREHNGYELVMKSFTCLCGQHHTVDAARLDHRCLSCNRVLIDLTPETGFVRDPDSGDLVTEYPDTDTAGSGRRADKDSDDSSTESPEQTTVEEVLDQFGG